MKQLVAGVDIGGTSTAFGLVDEKGNILFKETVPTEDMLTPENLAASVAVRIRKDISFLGHDYLLAGVGIGAPNGNYFKGTIEFAPNLKWKGIIPLAKIFSAGLDCKAVLTNDANAAALGELLFGGAKGMKDFIVITLGTGLGSGIVVNGEMVYGHDGFAGELGHVIMFPDGRQCGCGRKGCLERYCSATGIVRTYLEMKGGESDLKVQAAVSAKYICEKAQQGEKEALEAFRFTGEILGWALANAVAFSSPEAIFLFGGLVQSGELIFGPTINSFESNLLTIYRNKVKIIPSQLKENDAAILGAASLIWKELKS